MCLTMTLNILALLTNSSPLELIVKVINSHFTLLKSTIISSHLYGLNWRLFFLLHFLHLHSVLDFRHTLRQPLLISGLPRRKLGQLQ